MEKYLILIFIFASCNKPPQITYIDNVITKYDTITDYSFGGVDTIYSTTPCDSFTVLVRKNDTVYIREVKKVVQTKLVTKRDTVFRQVIINNPQPKKVDNSVTAKKGGIIGNGNTQTNNYDFWKGFFTCFLIFVIYFALRRTIKSYFPFLNFLP